VTVNGAQRGRVPRFSPADARVADRSLPQRPETLTDLLPNGFGTAPAFTSDEITMKKILSAKEAK